MSKVQLIKSDVHMSSKTYRDKAKIIWYIGQSKLSSTCQPQVWQSRLNPATGKGGIVKTKKINPERGLERDPLNTIERYPSRAVLGVMLKKCWFWPITFLSYWKLSPCRFHPDPSLASLSTCKFSAQVMTSNLLEKRNKNLILMRELNWIPLDLKKRQHIY